MGYVRVTRHNVVMVIIFKLDQHQTQQCVAEFTNVRLWQFDLDVCVCVCLCVKVKWCVSRPTISWIVSVGLCTGETRNTLWPTRTCCCEDVSSATQRPATVWLFLQVCMCVHEHVKASMWCVNEAVCNHQCFLSRSWHQANAEQWSHQV